MGDQSYALITPAKNEAEQIGRTIESVLAQTIRPSRWVIVSNGSTDRTEDIVAEFARKHSFIELVRTGQDVRRDFSAKVRAFEAGYKRLQDEPYDFVGNLDADVSIASNYFQSLLERFANQPDLGIAGGVILELVGNHYVRQRISSNSVAGAIQLFRRDCYEAIGGYTPLKLGGVDAAAEITARMKGWTVRTFPDLLVYHHRRVTTGSNSVYGTRFREGVTNYVLGYHPVFQLLSSLSRIGERPYIVGSLINLLGYMWSYAKRQPRAVPEDTIRHLRAEQIQRLISCFRVRRNSSEIPRGM
jgi:glycosyltransferase involved in cell wall biosynthesis